MRVFSVVIMKTRLDIFSFWWSYLKDNWKKPDSWTMTLLFSKCDKGSSICNVYQIGH